LLSPNFLYSRILISMSRILIASEPGAKTTKKQIKWVKIEQTNVILNERVYTIEFKR